MLAALLKQQERKQSTHDRPGLELYTRREAAVIRLIKICERLARWCFVDPLRKTADEHAPRFFTRD